MKLGRQFVQWIGRRIPGGRHPEVATLVGAGTTLTGSVAFRGVFRLDGTLIGSIDSSDMTESVLVVGTFGQVTGAVACARVVVAGSVVGPVKAGLELELHPGARVTGEVWCKSLEIHAGGRIEGRVNAG